MFDAFKKWLGNKLHSKPSYSRPHSGSNVDFSSLKPSQITYLGPNISQEQPKLISMKELQNQPEVLFTKLPPKELVIVQPRLGVLNFLGQQGESLADNDVKSLGPLFWSTQRREELPLDCDVLFIYCDIDPNGAIQGSSTTGLREIIRDTHARIVVIASENPSQHYTKSSARKKFGYANLVMTMQRKGESFTDFFWKLFTLMHKGRSMPMAWVELAPQNPDDPHIGCPATIFLCEAGQIKFA